MQTKLKISTACLQNSILTHTPRQYRRCHLPTGSQQRPATGVSDGEKGGIKLPGQRVPFPPFSAQARERVGWARQESRRTCGRARCAASLPSAGGAAPGALGSQSAAVPPPPGCAHTHTHPGWRGAGLGRPHSLRHRGRCILPGPASPRAHPRAPSCRGNGPPPGPRQAPAPAPPAPTPAPRPPTPGSASLGRAWAGAGAANGARAESPDVTARPAGGVGGAGAAEVAGEGEAEGGAAGEAEGGRPGPPPPPPASA